MQRLTVLLADAVAVAVAPARRFQQRARLGGVERIGGDLGRERPGHGLDGSVRDRRQAVQDGGRDGVSIDGVQQGAPDLNVAKGGHAALIERDVLVGIARRAMDGHARNGRHLAVLVPGEHRDQMDFAALELVDPRVRVGDEAEEDLLDVRVLAAAPVVGHAFQAGCIRPLFHSATR